MTRSHAPTFGLIPTDATGHIGFATLVGLLKTGYRVRIASRKREVARQYTNYAAIRPYRKSLSFIEVQNILVEVFDEALKDVHHVIHIATRTKDDSLFVTNFGSQKISIDAATQATMDMLRAAGRSSSVQLVIITYLQWKS